MSNDNNRQLSGQAIYGFRCRTLYFIGKSAGGVIKHQNVGLFIQRPSNANPLTLAAAQANTTLAHKGFVTPSTGFNKAGDLGLVCSQAHSFVISLILLNTKGNVFSDGAISQIDALRNMGDAGAPGTQKFRSLWIMQILAIYQHLALGGREQAHQQIHRGALPTTRAADQADALTRTDLRRNALEHLRKVRAIAEIHSLQP